MTAIVDKLFTAIMYHVPLSPSRTGSFGEVGVMEFGLKGTSRLVAYVTGSRHSGLGFTVFWLFTAQ